MSEYRAILVSREQLLASDVRQLRALPRELLEAFDAAGDQPRIRSRITHGRHCTCSACAREDWTPVNLPCGMHGSECPNRYQPWGPVGQELDVILVPLPEQP